MNQSVGNHQCYALSAEYSGVMNGAGMAAGTKYEILHQIGNIYSAADIGNAYKWNLYGWTVIEEPIYSQLKIGAIINWKRGAKVSDYLIAHTCYGHTGVIRGLNSDRIQTYEQNAEMGEIVAEYDRDFYNSNQIASICIPPDFKKGVIDEWQNGTLL